MSRLPDRTAVGRVPMNLQRMGLYWPEELLEDLDRLAASASRGLALDVPRAAVVRAGVEAWLANATQRPPKTTIWEIGAEARRSAIPLRSRYAMRWPRETGAHIARLASLAAGELACRVRPAAVIRAALRAWLADVAQRPPKEVLEEIRTAMVKRGRKAKNGSPRGVADTSAPVMSR